MLRFILPAIVWTLFVIFLSVIPGSSLDVGWSFEGLDKLVHVTMYAFSTLFWVVGLSRQNKNRSIREKAIKISVLSVFMLSFLLEMVQFFFVPFRYFDFMDLIANGIGCIFGVIIFKLIYRDLRRI